MDMQKALLLMLPLLVFACGGSDTNGSTGGRGGGGGAVLGSGGVSGGQGGAIAGVGGSSGGGGSQGAGGSSSPADGGDAPVGTPNLDALLDGLVIGDSGPMVIDCPADVATASCTPGTLCTRRRDGAAPDGCGCIPTGKWFCPGLTIGTDGGVSVPDGGIPDAAGFPMCAAGTATGGACTTEGAICTGAGSVGCACTQLAGSLRWVCL